MSTDLRRMFEAGRLALRDRGRSVSPTVLLLIVSLIVALPVSVLVAGSWGGPGRGRGGEGSPVDGRLWSAARLYRRGQVVEHGGALWRAKVDNVNSVPGPEAGVGVPQGFGENATGGVGGTQYWVTTLADSGPGSLREAAENGSALWIRFRVSGEIRLESPIEVQSHKTIDARGADVTLTNQGLILRGVTNVVVENLRFRRGTGRATDAVGIREEARHIWIDHCDFASYPDGLVDITEGGTDVTVSWSAFSEQNKVMLINGRAEGGRTVSYSPRVTLHHNLFDRTYQRNPRALHGLVHAYNNYLREWGGYGMRASENGELYSEANILEAGADKRALLTQPGRNDFAPGLASSTGDLLGGEALTRPRLPSEVFVPSRFYTYDADLATPALRERILTHAGWSPTPFSAWTPLDEDIDL